MLRVGVLRGGPSSEHEVSIKTGDIVLKNLSPKYEVFDIYLDKKGNWHIGGVPIDPHNAISRVDVIFNALHGEYGEDGKIQDLLDYHKVPYTGSDSLSSAITMNKILTKEIAANHGIKTPVYTTITADMNPLDIFKRFPMPAVIKPISGFSSKDIYIVSNLDELKRAMSFEGEMLLEEFINGSEATVGVIEKYRNEDLYALPPIEIHNHKVNVPSNFSLQTKEELTNLAKKIHNIFSLKHYSKSDFIVHPKRGIYMLEVNSLPKIGEKSLFPQALHSVGSSVAHFLEHLVELAISQK